MYYEENNINDNEMLQKILRKTKEYDSDSD